MVGGLNKLKLDECPWILDFGFWIVGVLQGSQLALHQIRFWDLQKLVNPKSKIGRCD
jgi:hypothetical protein